MDFDENKRRRANMYGATKAQKQAYMDSRTGNAGQGLAGNSLVDSVLRRNMADDAGESVVYNNNKKYTFDKNYDYPESRYSVNEQGQTEMFDAPWLTTDDTYAGMFGYG